MYFNDYEEAKRYADNTGLPLWDTQSSPSRYYVGHLTAEAEDSGMCDEWVELL